MTHPLEKDTIKKIRNKNGSYKLNTLAGIKN